MFHTISKGSLNNLGRMLMSALSKSGSWYMCTCTYNMLIKVFFVINNVSWSIN